LKQNLKILLRAFLSAVMVLVLMELFIKDAIAKEILGYVALGIITAFFFVLILFLIKPQWFKNKPEY